MRGAAPLALAVCAAVAAGSPAWAERLTIAMSTQEVKIDSSFTGINLTVFGVISERALTTAEAGPYRLAVLILGPQETAVVRRKERFVGVWANGATETMVRPPSLYELSTSGPTDTLADPAVLQQLGIGFDNIAFRFAGRDAVNDSDASAFREAYIRLKQKQGLFTQETGVTFIAGLIFRANLHLPANIPVGHYTAITYLFDGKQLLAHAQDGIEVSTTGFEATMTSFAHNQALVYGILCATLALFIGWLGGVIFRRD